MHGNIHPHSLSIGKFILNNSKVSYYLSLKDICVWANSVRDKTVRKSRMAKITWGKK